MPGLRIHFDLDFDQGSWPGPLGSRDATSGELWVGPAGLVGRLEVELGLGGAYPSLAERAAALMKAVQDTPGYWSRSAAADPLSTARLLLRERDELVTGGWRGEGLTPRLATLAAVTGGAPPGLADRLAAIEAALATRKTQIERASLLAPVRELPLLWRRVFERLARQGVTVAEAHLEPVDGSGDLARSRSRPFEPSGDGSLQLLRPHGCLEAASLVAAWLAAQDDLAGTVVIGADPVLDAALHSHGLPTTGGAAGHRGDCLSQVLPLVLELALAPADPAQAALLLTLPSSPVPPSIAWRLLDALQRWPAVGSEAWNAALDRGLTSIDDAERRVRVRERLGAIFGATLPRDQPYPVPELIRRAELVERWARGNLLHRDEAPWTGVVAQTTAFRRLVEHTGKGALTRFETSQLLDQATDGAPGCEPYPAEAGLTVVGSPGAVAGPARRVVWWSFTRDSASVPRAPVLDPGERDALRRAGVELPDAGARAEQVARRWRRPFALARDALLLVCPETGEDGDEAHPHPVWDEIESAVPEHERKALLARIEVPRPIGLAATRRELAPVPAPVHAFDAGRELAPRAQESPSSLEKLVACPLGWVLRYVARLEDGPSVSLGSGPLLYGNLAHRLLERVAADASLTPEQAAEQTRRAFDDEGPSLAAALFLPGAEAERFRLRQTLGAAARALVEVLRRGGLRVSGVESEHRRTVLGFVLEGRVDLLLEPGPSVLDLKWGRYADRRRDLHEGAAFQLTAYSHVLTGKGKHAPVAYFVIDGQRLVTSDPHAFPSAEVVDGPSPAEAWDASAATLAGRLAELGAGRVLALAMPADGEEPPANGCIVDGALVLPPPCGYCGFGTLCGLAFAEEAP